ncbi:type IV toxin-antitoxin system AbiEi family antitoxin [Snuella lapsa]|uniref:type IV toxin-antitoxin system AbiEi family antitoxin domain-containing protein n=1 Tax=Snuella lapsa TaxID=870481 RepID=UPI0031E9098B
MSDFIKERLSLEIYSFNKEELHAISQKNKLSISSDLSYLTKKGEIVPLRKGFYLIIPPRYSKQQKLPIELYVENLFKFIERPYYIGLYSAAKLQGAGHQQIQKDYVVTMPPTLLNIKKSNTNIHFFTTSNWPKKNIISRKSDAGYFKISDAILTSVDLIYHQTKLGGINRMLAIIEELTEEVKLENLKDLLSWYPHRSSLQRLGFILEELQADTQLIELLKNHLKDTTYFPVLLSPKSKEKPGAVDNFWKVDVNIRLENDL